MTFVVDRQATKIARARHQRGVARLDVFFAFDLASAVHQLTEKRAYPTCDRPARRKRTKAQRVARRRNRS